MEHLPAIIAVGRAALEASTSSALFVLDAGLSLAFLSLLSACSVSTCIPYIPTLGSMLYLLVLMPLLGLSMAWSDAQSESMSTIPPKNDDSIIFGRDEGKRLYGHMIIRAFLPAMGSHLLYLISLGQLLLALEPDYLEQYCPEINLSTACWTHVIRCPILSSYSGAARVWSGSLMLGQLALCLIIASAGFVFRTRSLREEPPWWRNPIWLFSCVISLLLTVLYMVLSIGVGVASSQVARALPYYYYILSFLFPPFWLFVGEVIKKVDRKHEKRACTLRRLQFETRLGMWSPKENK
jgi:magnesium-transporting ATPase (P-type)